MLKLQLPFACLFVISCLSCTGRNESRRWADVEKSGQLLVITRNSSVSYFSGREGEEVGFEYDLVRAFAKHLKVSVQVEVAKNQDELLAALRAGHADIALGGFLTGSLKGSEFLPSPVFDRVTEQIVCRQDTGVKRIQDLADKTVMVMKGSTFQGVAENLNKSVPTAKLYYSSDASVDQILQMVWEGGPQCTIADSESIQINRSFMPELSEIISLGSEKGRLWYFGNRHDKLVSILTSWLTLPTTKKLISDLKEVYFRHPLRFDYFNKKVFLARATNRLPKYKKQFQKAGEVFKVPWQLLAAIGYQESHWDENAVSPTGVEGLMMLTKRAAKDLGVENRKDPEQSIFGGAKFYMKLLGRLPPYIRYPERYWFGLAAYNIGYGHMHDARKIAIDLNLNPNSWEDVNKALPLLSQEKYFKDTKYGYARGQEPVVYVYRIREYFEELKKIYPK